MPIDAGIIGGLRPPQLIDPLEQQGKAMNLMAARQQIQMQPLRRQAAEIELQKDQLGLQEAELKRRDDDIVSRTYTIANGDPKLHIAAAAKAGARPQAVQSLDKHYADLREKYAKIGKDEADAKKYSNEQLRGILNSAEQDPNYESNYPQYLQAAKAVNPEMQLPDQPIPKDQLRILSLQFATDENLQKEAAAKRQQDEAKRAAELHPFKVEAEKAEMEQIARERYAREHPEDATAQRAALKAKDRMDAARSALEFEDKKRHEGVMERQGAGRLSVEQQQLELQKNRYGFETGGGVSDAARMAAEGKMAPATLRSMLRSNPGLIGQIRQVDPNFDEADVETRYKTLQEFNSTSNSRAGGQVIALNALVHHADLYMETAEALKNGTFRPGNAVYNKVATMFGAAPPTNAALVARFFAGETGKVATGGVPAEGEINGILKNLGTDASPEAIAGAGKTLLQIAGGRMTPLMELAKQAKIDKLKPVLGEDARQILQKRGFDPNTMKPAAAQSKFSVGDSVMYNGKQHKITAIKPDGKLVLEQ